ncbi:Uncharacterised protein [Kocuria rosea]|nr:Uncharacterised protein [Kocuria rosea]
MARAGTRKIGSSSTDSAVTCHEIETMTTTVRIRETMLLTTPESVLENARWAPMTSLLSRETRAPVRVRVKKAIGIRCTWS